MSCPDCFAGHKHDGTPKGTVEKLHGLDAYVSRPAAGKAAKGIIVIIPDAFGMPFVNNRLLADHYVDKGDFIVYLPDFMRGGCFFFCLRFASWIVSSMSCLRGFTAATRIIQAERSPPLRRRFADMNRRSLRAGVVSRCHARSVHRERLEETVGIPPVLTLRRCNVEPFP